MNQSKGRVIISRRGAGGGGEATILRGRVVIFSLLSWGGSQFFQDFFRGGS